MIRQVFVQERVTDSEGTIRVRVGMAFGDHPDFTLEEDDREVLEAIAQTNVPICVVFDELLLGNNLEELVCLDGTFARVPLDADPDDIADCAPINLDLGNCTAVCAANGGIKDENMDGAPDADGGRQMIQYQPGVLGVAIICDGANIPFDPLNSFYSPAGNQQITAGPLGINSLGPAVILQPDPLTGIRTGSTCTLTVNPAVVDKDNNAVCAPPNGDITQSCTPGDTTLVSFNTEVLRLSQSDPQEAGVNVPVVTGLGPDKDFTLVYNAPIAVESIATAFTLIEDPAGAALDRTGDITVVVNAVDAKNLTMTIAGGLAGDTAYELRTAVTLTDKLGGPLPQAQVLSFTTGMGVGPDAAPDA